MSELAKKLGIKEGDFVCLLGAPAEASETVRASSPPGVSFFEDLGGERQTDTRYDIIMFWPQTLAGLAEQFAELQGWIRLAGAIWAVMPKKKFARARGVDYTWEQMQAAGLQTDLVDNKVASITGQDYGTRFVIRKDLRHKYETTA